MRMRRVKRCMGLCFLLLLAGCSARGNAELSTGTGLPSNQMEQQEKQQAEPQKGKQEEPQEKEVPEPIVKEEGIPADVSVRDDEDFYVKCLQNLNQGNNITYADEYYYFRSQAENYSLCRTKGMGMPVEIVADQVPGSIYVRGDQVYFVNVSDNRSLYCVGTDGSGLGKLSDLPMQELLVLEDKIYFGSVYDRENDPFYQLTEEAAEGDQYLYSMNLDGSGCKLLIPRQCMEFVTDGEWLYYLIYEEEEGYVLYKNSLDGKEEEKILQKEGRIWDILPYRGSLYWVDAGQEQLVRLNGQGIEEILASDVSRFTIARGQAYIMNTKEIHRFDLMTGKESLLAKREKTAENSVQDRENWTNGSDNRGIFLVNGQVFAKYFESETKGVLWHVLDGENFVVFEDMEPMAAEELVLDTSLLYETNFYYPGRMDENAEKYLDVDGELCYEESVGTNEDGTVRGNFKITLPKFNSELVSYEQLNQQMEKLMELALEDKDSFFQEVGEQDPEDRISWYRNHTYGHLYIDENYISMYYARSGYEGGMRDWRNSMPLVFDRETGLMLDMDHFFTVEETVYKKRLTGAIYKYCEMTGQDWWNDVFDNNVLVKNLGDLRYYLTPDGLVLCYERYEIQPGASGSPTFEIPYAWFEDILKLRQ